MRRAVVPLLILFVAAACATNDSDPSSATTPPASTGSDSQDPDAAPSQPEVQASAAPGGGLQCWSAPAAGGESGITFVDRTADYGLVEPLTGMHGHAAAWGDITGDLVPDLLFGTFADKPLERYQERGADGPKPDTLLVGGASFAPTSDLAGSFGRSSGAAIVDLDNDGDLDLVVSRNVADKERGDLGSAVYRNDGGTLTPAEAGIDPNVSGRSIGVIDYDRDGLVDLVILEDRYKGSNSRLYRNLGDLRFEDTTAAAGLPEGIHGLGIATADIDLDGATDFFVAGSNRLFLGTGSGFTEATLAVLAWEPIGDEDDVAGAAFADIDLDGRLDLVIGHHYNSTVAPSNTEVPIRLYLNRTEAPGAPAFDDVTEAAGLAPLPTKAPHVEFADLDNDGLVDILTSASAGDGGLPAVFRNTGLRDGIPRFEAPTGLGSDQYWVTAPTADLDRDGRLDLVAVEWFPSLPSIVFSNQSASGNWLEVSIAPEAGTAIGTRVAIYEAGSAGDPTTLLGHREITATQGYASGSELLAHFGLGVIEAVDVILTLPGADPVTLSDVAANQAIRYPSC